MLKGGRDAAAWDVCTWTTSIRYIRHAKRGRKKCLKRIMIGRRGRRAVMRWWDDESTHVEGGKKHLRFSSLLALSRTFSAMLNEIFFERCLIPPRSHDLKYVVHRRLSAHTPASPAPLSRSLMKSTILYEDKIDKFYVTFAQHIFAYTHHIGVYGWIDNLSFFTSIFSSSLHMLPHSSRHIFPTAWGSDVQLNQITEIILVSRRIEMCWALTCIDSAFSLSIIRLHTSYE